jgi:hypothetical protein
VKPNPQARAVLAHATRWTQNAALLSMPAAGVGAWMAGVPLVAAFFWLSTLNNVVVSIHNRLAAAEMRRMRQQLESRMTHAIDQLAAQMRDVGGA